jgi:hypothetical protein
MSLTPILAGVVISADSYGFAVEAAVGSVVVVVAGG